MNTISSKFLTVDVADRGAELRSIRRADGTEYLWQGDAKYWDRSAPNLFPFTGRLIDRRYRMDGQEYSMLIHGMAPYVDFEPVYNDGAKLIMELRANEEALAQYPRDFRFRIVYELSESTLNICYEIENADVRTMYFGLGGHPGFNVPLEPGLRFEDYRIRFDSDSLKRVLFTSDGFVSGEFPDFSLEDGTVLPLRHELFDNDAIFLRNAGHSVTLESPKGSASVKLRFPDMDYIGVWHLPYSDAPYVCLEPWCSLPAQAGIPTVFEEHPDLIRLEPGKAYENRWSIEIK